MSVDLQEAAIYSRMELKSYGLKDYSILWREWSRTLGEAHPWKKTIYISYDCLKNKELLIEVVKHEIAHCLDFQERGTFLRDGRNDHHGKSWRKWCKFVGVKARMKIPV
jgi:predicted SprT family Zn-dependent metalloprotease